MTPDHRPSRDPAPRRALLSFALVAASAGVARASPEVLVPVEPKRIAERPPALDLPRESDIDVPLSGERAASATAIGGYGELTLDAPLNDDPTVADVRRLVLFFGHSFTDRLRFYSELEVEHAVVSSTDKGEFEVEQAFVDYLPSRAFNLRGGLLLVPVGSVNLFHEPTAFNGVDRPDTEVRIIPSTWRELGAGVFGALGPLRYQAYLVTGLSARGFSSDTGVREGHQEGQLARARDVAGTARLELQPLLGLTLGLAGYYGGSGQGAPGTGTTPVGMVEADVRARWRGLELRGELAGVFIGDAAALDRSLAADPKTKEQGPVASQLRGGFVEAGYDVLHPAHLASGAQLVAWARYERTDTQAALPPGEKAADKTDWQTVTAGLTFRPVAELVVKADWQYRTRGGGDWYHQLNLGLGWAF